MKGIPMKIAVCDKLSMMMAGMCVDEMQMSVCAGEIHIIPII